MVKGYGLFDDHDGDSIAYRVGQFVCFTYQIPVALTLFQRAFTNRANQHVNQMCVQLLSPVGGSAQGVK